MTIEVSTPPGSKIVRPFEVTNRLMLAITIPVMLASLTTPLLGLVDTAVIGQLGDPHLLGGLAIGALVFDFLFSTMNFLRSGTTGLVAQAMGRHDNVEQQAVFWRAIGIAAVAGMLFIAATPLVLQATISFMNPDKAVADAMSTYVSIRLLSSPMALGNFVVLGSVVRARQGHAGPVSSAPAQWRQCGDDHLVRASLWAGELPVLRGALCSAKLSRLLVGLS